ncbi:hypothetical protein SLNWT_5189 [Streptomyces albus]|uniref:Uncharacterized protein n=1 Tax=Streptomyces albus (strain ATCC 21838 / DSM 41398 / FERM P-419 / JCM 4703 / NBRC 107858) TaxID=1081613 RepID=A0A0B5F1T8_STRA4|nr:hypothetical protein SLNWT_5189 [Streptomyces albus]AOU79869.1 hypothetical protein SLNHY_5178 [Streptomyces albus]AYN35592.1 hypothetical protein DUI70_5094 [Streptomyces albus]
MRPGPAHPAGSAVTEPSPDKRPEELTRSLRTLLVSAAGPTHRAQSQESM